MSVSCFSILSLKEMGWCFWLVELDVVGQLLQARDRDTDSDCDEVTESLPLGSDEFEEAPRKDQGENRLRRSISVLNRLFRFNSF